MGERFSWDKLLRRGKQDEDNTINITPNEEPMAPVASLKSTTPVAQSVPLAKASPDTMAPPPMAQEPTAPKAPLVIEWNQYQQIAESAQPPVESAAAPAPPTVAPPVPASNPVAQAPAGHETSEVAHAFWNKMGSETAEALHSTPAAVPPAPAAGINLGWDDVELTPAERAAGKTGELPPVASIPTAPEISAPVQPLISEIPPAVAPMTPAPAEEAPAGVVEADIFQPIQVELLGASTPEWAAPAPVEAAIPAPIAPESIAPASDFPVFGTSEVPPAPAAEVEVPPTVEPLVEATSAPVSELKPASEGLQPIEVGEPRWLGTPSSINEEKPRLMGFGEGTRVLGSTSEPISQETSNPAEPAPVEETPVANPWASLTKPVETPTEAPAASAWNLPPVTAPAPEAPVSEEAPQTSAWNLPPVTPVVSEVPTLETLPTESAEAAPAAVEPAVSEVAPEAPIASAWNMPPVAEPAQEQATNELPPIAAPIEETTSAWGQIDTAPEAEPPTTEAPAAEAPFSWSQISEAAPVMPAPIMVEEPLVAELPPVAEPIAPTWEASPASVAPSVPPIFESPAEVTSSETEAPEVLAEAPQVPANEVPSIFTTPPAAEVPAPEAPAALSDVPSIFTPPPASETPAAPPSDPTAIPPAYAKRSADDLSVQKARDNRLGDLLVGNKLITQKQLDRALERQKETNERLGQILIAMQTMSEKRLLQVLSAQKGVSPWHLETDAPTQEAVALVPEQMCRIFQVIPVAIRGDLLLLAMRDTEDIEAIEAIRNHTKRRIEPVLADEARLAYTIDKSFGIAETRRLAAMDELVGEALHGVDNSRPLGTQERAILSEEDTRPVVGLVNQIIEDGIRMRASDVHIEPGYEKIEIRYRLDGRLTTVRDLPIELLPMLVARVKILSELDIVEYRMPQDGRITAQFGPHVVDLRVSVLPNYHGPRVVLRILDKSVGLKKLTDLGFEDRNLSLFKDLVAKPYGLFLVTGPTGSGKTTTLYSALNELRDTATNIMTCEDPVEYDLAGINQSQVNEKVGLTFAHQLRAILRQDPDVVLVGEIRDKETAETAIRAAMTGHMVLSTLHCNDAPGAIPRLLDMGVDPYLLSTALVGTMSQRLVRVLCSHCKTEDDATAEETETMAKLFGVPDVKKIWRANGCDECYNTGYKGRMAVHEILPVAEEIAHLIAERAPMETLRTRAGYYGYLPMQQDAAARVLRGETTLEEAKRLISFDTFEKLDAPRSLEWKSAS